MEPSFWQGLWERSDIGFHKADININLKKFWGCLDLRPGQHVLVPLCGKSFDMLWLAGEGYRVTGIELSPLACQAFFAENNLNPARTQEGSFEVWEADEIRILQGSIFDVQKEQVGDCRGVYDRGALVALPPDMRERYVRNLAATLPDTAKMLLLALEFDQALRPGPPFSINEAEVKRLYEPAFQVELLHTHDLTGPDAQDPQPPSREEKVYRITHRVGL